MAKKNDSDNSKGKVTKKTPIKKPTKPKIADYQPAPATTPKQPKLIVPKGRTQSFLWYNEPESGWLPVEDHAKWRGQLPNSYTYRARAVDKNGKPVPITRVRGIDETGHLYCGETGVKENDPSFRGEKLAAGLADKAIGMKKGAHGGAKKFWADGWDKKLPPGYKLEFGWDTQTDFVMPANKDEREPVDKQTDEMIANSGKGFAMGVENRIIRPYTQNHKEWPPLNSADSPGFRDRDRKTKNELDKDRKDRSDGEVEGI
jgi:hypothetical protein